MCNKQRMQKEACGLAQVHLSVMEFSFLIIVSIIVVPLASFPLQSAGACSAGGSRNNRRRNSCPTGASRKRIAGFIRLRGLSSAKSGCRLVWCCWREMIGC